MLPRVCDWIVEASLPKKFNDVSSIKSSWYYITLLVKSINQLWYALCHRSDELCISSVLCFPQTASLIAEW